MKTITHDEIKEKLVRHYDPTGSAENPRMEVMHIDIDTSGQDVVFFALSGCPPEGYGIFIQGHKSLILYNTRGVPFEGIEVDEVVSSYTE